MIRLLLLRKMQFSKYIDHAEPSSLAHSAEARALKVHGTGGIKKTGRNTNVHLDKCIYHRAPDHYNPRS